jgi:predicted membrane protein
VFGQPLLSNDFVPSNPSAVSLTEVSIGNQTLYGSVAIFQETFQISSEQLSQVPFNIDDW